MKIAIFGDAPTIGSGYGVVALYLGRELIKRGVEVAWMPLQYSGGTELQFEGGYIYAGDMFSVEDGVRRFKPDYLMHIRDNWVFTKSFFQQPYSFKQLWDRYNIKQINYTPVQAAPVPQEFIDSLKNEAHLTFVTTKWARDYFITEGIEEKKVDYLYHGVDRDVFKSLKIPNVDNTTKRFIFMGANYDYRKNMPFLLKAFKKYKEVSGDEKSQLYIHCNLSGHYHMPSFMRILKFKPEEILFKPSQTIRNYGVGMPHRELGVLYNWANIYVTATISEGFDIPVLEAESVGLPVVLTEFPVHRELFSRFRRTNFVKSYNDYATVWGFEWMPDMDDFVEKMIKVEPGIIDRNENDFAEFDWKVITDRFLKVLEEKIPV